MRIIKNYVEKIDEELEGAKEYAEKYIELKVKDDMNSANKYKEMAMDELKHATYEHEWATKEIAKISSVYDAPMDMMEKWEKSHKEYVEKVAWIRQMLSM
jgi:predicted translin family RNA/ssDNA-binding protein